MSARQIDLRIPLPSNQAQLLGILTLPLNPTGLVVFAHGSGSSHRSPRNQYVAQQLNQAGLATALADLLSLDEEREDSVTARIRFDISFLTHRLNHIIAYLRTAIQECQLLPIGTFGASTGGAAAIEAAALHSDEIHAIVSRGGRPDLANPTLLAKLTVPTLLLVGSRDTQVIDLNRRAMARMTGCVEKRLELVEGATHLFEEAGALEKVTELSVQWFCHWLGQAAAGKGQRRVTQTGEAMRGEGAKRSVVAEGKMLESEEKEA